MRDYKILFKVTSRSRPEKLKKVLQNIQEQVLSNSYRIQITIDENDKQTNRPTFLHWIDMNIRNCYYITGKSYSKVHAINRDVKWAGDWDILVNVSDDQQFIEFGFDDIIRHYFDSSFPDLDGFLHFKDENVGSRLCTMSILGRKYYERFGYIYHPDYTSLWCDNEATEVAKLLKKYKYVEEPIAIHKHPAWGFCDYDEQYITTESFFNEDKLIFLAHKKKNFGL